LVLLNRQSTASVQYLSSVVDACAFEAWCPPIQGKVHVDEVKIGQRERDGKGWDWNDGGSVLVFFGGFLVSIYLGTILTCKAPYFLSGHETARVCPRNREKHQYTFAQQRGSVDMDIGSAGASFLRALPAYALILSDKEGRSR
jgi:hypothetical protein